jgi:hypothetical protein
MARVLAGVAAVTLASSQASAQQQKRPNVVMLMSDDTGWTDLGCYLGGAALGHPTPNLIAWPRKARCSPVGMARRSRASDDDPTLIEEIAMA